MIHWFQDWTLTYMVWWIAWGLFVGVFIARISQGRTVREFVMGVLIGPTLFSIIWIGTFGGIGFYDALLGTGELLALTANNLERLTFGLLERLPFTKLTTIATIVAAFMLGTFSSGGDPDPTPKVRLVWGVLLGVLGGTMVLSGSIDAVKKLIALGALPFVFVSILLFVCMLCALRDEDVKGAHHADR